MVNLQKNRVLIIFLVVLLLLTGFELWFYFKYSSQKSGKTATTKKQESMTEKEKVAQKVIEETLKQQATMSATGKNNVVLEECKKLPYTDPLFGIYRINKGEGGKTSGAYTYLGKIISVADEKRGKCIDSVITLSTNNSNFKLRLPKQMQGTGALGSILPEILSFKKGMRIILRVNYKEVVKDKYLYLSKWEVENLIIN